MAALQVRQDMRCGMTQISQNAKFGGTIRAAELQWFSGIVRYCEWHELQAAEVDGLSVSGKTQQAVKVR